MAAYGFAPRPSEYFGGGNSFGRWLGGLDQAIIGGIDAGTGVATGLRNFDYGNVMADYALPAGMAQLLQARLGALLGAGDSQARLDAFTRMGEKAGEAASTPPVSTPELTGEAGPTPLDLMGIARDIGAAAVSPADPLGTSGMSHTSRMLNLFPYTYRSALY